MNVDEIGTSKEHEETHNPSPEAVGDNPKNKRTRIQNAGSYSTGVRELLRFDDVDI